MDNSAIDMRDYFGNSCDCIRVHVSRYAASGFVDVPCPGVCGNVRNCMDVVYTFGSEGSTVIYDAWCAKFDEIHTFLACDAPALFQGYQGCVRIHLVML